MAKDFSKESRQFFADLGEPVQPVRKEPAQNTVRTFSVRSAAPPAEAPAPVVEPVADLPLPEVLPPARPDTPASPMDALVPRTLYITDRQARALKIRLGLSQDPRERDMSAIVRIALDQYLADTLKMMG